MENMRSVDEHEFLQEFDELLHEVENGAEMIITRDGRPIAHIGPMTEAAAETIRKLQDE